MGVYNGASSYKRTEDASRVEEAIQMSMHSKAAKGAAALNRRKFNCKHQGAYSACIWENKQDMKSLKTVVERSDWYQFFSFFM